ncbi:toll-like receptor 3 [Mercenaria mercenaria]|uniref:toll-like receptor 3 n=1 Tax=Mercenaria mercenaria TaxID=6596 RepID=UPI00234F1E03|nr:toll-like receptor 3 [Mercenaria mercenaria]
MRICWFVILFAYGSVTFGYMTIHNDNNDRRKVTRTSDNCELLTVGSTELYADYSYRGLTKVPDRLPNNITCLNMVGNILTSLAGSPWGKYTSLRKLSLARNRIDELRDRDFVGLSNLEMLDLSLDKIHYHAVHEYAFRHLESLKYLDLKQNITKYSRVETYPQSLQYLRKLELNFDIFLMPSPACKEFLTLGVVSRAYINGHNLTKLTERFVKPKSFNMHYHGEDMHGISFNFDE